MDYFQQMFFTKSKTQSSQDLLSIAFIEFPVAALLIDENGFILKINNSFAKLTGFSVKDIVGENMSILKSGKYNNAYYKRFYQTLQKNNNYELEIYNRTKDNKILLMKEKIVCVKSNEATYFICTLEDITDAKKLAQRHEFLATHDALTGLANRTLLKDRFSHAVSNAKRAQNHLALLMCDLNEFKILNDTYGHNFGDIVLKKVAKKLKENVRSNDTVARYGGDEFVIILEQLEEKEEARSILKGLKEVFPLRIEVENKVCIVNLSIGYSFFPNEGSILEDLLSKADDMMYDEKQNFYQSSK